MAISKLAIAAVASIMAGGTFGLTGTETTPAEVQSTQTVRGTPISHIRDAKAIFQGTDVQFTSGKTFGHVVGIATNDAGRATRIHVALVDMPSQQIWIDQGDLVYSRSRDVIIAHDVHAPAIAVADAH